MKAQIKKSIFFGLLAVTSLLAFYFMILGLASGLGFVRVQFSENWYWILSLSTGFGIQVGLLTHLRELHRQKVAGKIVAASGTTSTIAMISCCAHYLVNIFPVIGISGLVTIVGQYKTELFIVGLLSNLIGIAYLTNKLIKFNSLIK